MVGLYRRVSHQFALNVQAGDKDGNLHFSVMAGDTGFKSDENVDAPVAQSVSAPYL